MEGILSKGGGLTRGETTRSVAVRRLKWRVHATRQMGRVALSYRRPILEVCVKNKSNRKTRANAIKIGDHIVKAYNSRSPLSDEKHCDAAEDLLANLLVEAEDKGFEESCRLLEIKLLDGGEHKDPNTIRAEAAKRARELRTDIKKVMARARKV